jgi:DNA-binding IclR family transcriptional regulator
MMTPGDVRPLCKTVNGGAVFSLMSDSEVAEIVSAHNERFGREDYIQPAAILERTRTARAVGYASGRSTLVPGCAAICFALEDEERGEELLLTVELPASDLSRREHRVVEAARRVIPALAATSAGRSRHAALERRG